MCSITSTTSTTRGETALQGPTTVPFEPVMRALSWTSASGGEDGLDPGGVLPKVLQAPDVDLWAGSRVCAAREGAAQGQSLVEVADESPLGGGPAVDLASGDRQHHGSEIDQHQAAAWAASVDSIGH